MTKEIKRFGLDTERFLKITKILKMVLKLKYQIALIFKIMIFMKKCDLNCHFSEVELNNSKLKDKDKMKCCNRAVCREPQESRDTCSLCVLSSQNWTKIWKKSSWIKKHNYFVSLWDSEVLLAIWQCCYLSERSSSCD